MRHERTCLFKTAGKRKAGEDVFVPSKKIKDNVEHVGGALEDTLVDYCLDLENENQDDIFSTLKDSVFQLRNKIGEELTKKKAIKFYVSLHARFHLSMETTHSSQTHQLYSTRRRSKFMNQA